jgi:hypothetical protein
LLALPAETPTVDIHCVTAWSKLATTWRGVSVDTLLEGVETEAKYVSAWCDDGYRTNLPLEDVTGGRAWSIRVENPNDGTLLPRLESGREISTFTFDGKTLILTDSGGDTIESPTSGMKPHNSRNREKNEYTDPKHQWVAGRGPIPAGNAAPPPVSSWPAAG